MIVQIYSLTTPEDVKGCIDAGVDHLGVAAADQNLPASISNERARELFRLVPDDHKTVALTVSTDLEEIVNYANATNPDILHICSDTRAVNASDMKELQDRIPDKELMKAIDVNGPESKHEAVKFDPVSDWLILDTSTDTIDGIGASGETHDWSISKDIANETETPTILAGGLAPENVSSAIETVRPDGVDSFTRTSKTVRRKDIDRVREFVRNAKMISR
ncbi:MAG: hypothetical protein ABEI52_07210 [Halobacteriaceae archaeon]